MKRLLTAIAVLMTALAQLNAAEMNMNVTVGGKTFAATVADTETGRAFYNLLPLTLNMSELNGNEKYYYLDTALPTSAYSPGTIRAGDLMLYGNSCVVLFYETFASGYRYTRIGALDNPNGIAQALGGGTATVTFDKVSSAVTGITDMPEGNEVTAIHDIKGRTIPCTDLAQLPQGMYVVQYSNGETRKVVK